MKKKPSRLIVALIVVAVGAGALYVWSQSGRVETVHDIAAPPPIPPLASVEPAMPDPADASKPLAPAEPVTKFPLEPTEAAVPAPTPDKVLPALAESDPFVDKELQGLFQRKDFVTWVIPAGFVRHVVATVDNLGRAQAPKAVWPVHPTPGRFTTTPSANGEAISTDNSARYSPFVSFVEAVDSRKAVAVYVRLYPLFQQAYVELGFPKRYFNDRLVAIIDQLLATPKPTGELAVSLLEVKGPVPSLQPWVRYEFTDPALKALSSGQKIMLRVGPQNQRRLDAKLTELRKEIVLASQRGQGRDVPGM
ncbi:DUF3014 domain-containing protein [Actimicrobium sp. CCI2.3]|uniref:DUF3014 domain-containing protein n=1 Tax=Actimicrobium sp. CCI2.3 TaxID=3048616 RepID=UPI002AB50D21|nr:DUF3014 domain-containing protein [Actimicrobium sp. CCI2.3]MDY7574622.1 DUF3014 domain-containing protein [Actimicrobium sp. CCI2.3]MEB0023985.1 DUF3014 domain-containing protein [Actimicrobium sp. CCI2.3]